ncbi:MAG TPA: [protein-PII] uridylyltransferase [Candidatus Dormibacteraeota bacterium]|nr:[protein-PII] uridylyltransferase [Candidatus Dormibacteraeota bacterium]
MPTIPLSSSEMRDFYAEESAKIQRAFAENGDGRAAVEGRTSLVESVALQLWKEHISAEPEGPQNLALVALGGFGRRWLFPFSDVDILFLHSGAAERELKNPLRSFSQHIWDLRLKLSPTTRTLSECERFDANNVEFAISLLDCRYLAGDRKLFVRLHDQVIPKLVSRESRSIVQRLTDLTRARYNKFGNTVFHLEPNVKDGPGGLRDYNLACWLALIAAVDETGAWPDEGALLPPWLRQKFDAALDFLMSARCFLHFRHGRDDNTLVWEAQDEAAERHIGSPGSEPLTPAEWMRMYFGHARLIHRVAGQLLDEFPTARPSLYKQFQNLRSRLSNSEFAVVDSRLFLQRPESTADPELPLRLFRFLARHGLSLSSAAEHQLEESLPIIAAAPPKGAELWHHLQEILLAPHAGESLRAMHSLGLLDLLLPEFKIVDSLVIRDYSHRFTVDEHTFLTIENLHALRKSQSKWDQGYAELLDEIEQPDLLYLALLLHDTGKGAKPDDHIAGSLELAQPCLARLDVDEPDRETVLFLIAHHLDMGSALRRDIFDPQVIRQLAESMRTPEDLKMLCLFTYADIKSVNPEALTPWKAENLWQLYIGAANLMMRSADDRLHADEELVTHLRTLMPAAGTKLEGFLDGLPRRYLRTQAASDVIRHVDMASRLGADAVQLDLTRGRQWFELTLVTTDRPFLFSRMAGALAAWGMNIVKAAAFSNKAGVVVDQFFFTDRFHTLELNLPEWERFKGSVHDVILGKADLSRMLRDRLRSTKDVVPKVKVDTRVEVDDESSAHSTLVEVITQDRPGVLYRITSQLARHKCNIEIALIETEGQTAIDVFYVTSGGAKLSAAQQEQVRIALLDELSNGRPAHLAGAEAGAPSPA